MSTEMTAEDKALLKQKKRRRTIIIRRMKVSAVLCAVLALALYMLSAFVLFKIEKIDVTGITDSDGNVLPLSSGYGIDEIIAASGIQTGDSLVRLSDKNVSASIEKILPYIGNVTVKKIYPKTVRLIVEETSAYFAVSQNSTYTLLDRKFKVLGTSDLLPDGCAVLNGAEFKSAVIGETAEFTDDMFAQRLTNVADKCEKYNIKYISKFDLSNIVAVRFVIADRITVIIGTANELDEKMSMAVKTIKSELENNSEFFIVDVSDKDRAYVRDDSEAKAEFEKNQAANEPLPDDVNQQNQPAG